MSGFFGAKLGRWREDRGLTMGDLVRLSKISSQNLSGIERGLRKPSDANLAALAAVKDLQVDFESLATWRNVDRAGGPEAIKQIVRLVPEVLRDSSSPDAAITGPGAEPLTPREREIIRRMERTASLRDRRLQPGASLWLEPPDVRLRGLREMLADDGEDDTVSKDG